MPRQPPFEKVPPMQRRDFLLALAAGTAGCLSACNTARPAAHSASPASPPTQGSPLASTSPSPTPSPADSLITGLPENVGNVVAITIDDGVDSSVVDAYLDFAKDSGVRLTFFVTGCYPSWTDNRDKMRPLVESGQIQLANHTWTHPDLTTLSEGGIIDELTQCENLLRNTYGVTGAPFIRPPTTMWYGSFGDSGQLTPEVLLGEAQKWLLAQHIVIGHANFPTVTSVYGQIIDILRQRSLQTATLDDVYFGPGHNRHA